MFSNWPGLIDAHLGRQLRARRLRLRLKQADLAHILQVSIQQVHKYETAKSGLPVEKLLRLAQALRVPPAYFFDGIDGDAVARPRAQASKSASR